jgi:hypothetical protein
VTRKGPEAGPGAWTPEGSWRGQEPAQGCGHLALPLLPGLGVSCGPARSRGTVSPALPRLMTWGHSAPERPGAAQRQAGALLLGVPLNLGINEADSKSDSFHQEKLLISNICSRLN